MKRLIIRAIKLTIIYLVVMTILGLAFGTSTASAKAKCSAYKPSTFVVCVDASNAKTQKLWVIDSAGKTVYGPTTVTTSHVDDDGPNADKDTITRKGHWKLGTPQLKSSIGLRFYIPFAGGQGFHYYKLVGWGYDSHGCVRANMATAKWLYDNVGAAILAGKRAEAHIMV